MDDDEDEDDKEKEKRCLITYDEDSFPGYNDNNQINPF